MIVGILQVSYCHFLRRLLTMLFRYDIVLAKENDLLCDQLRALHNRRIIGDAIATVSEIELLHIDRQVKIVLGIEI